MSAAKRPEDTENTIHCADHSGMVTWRTGVVAILLALLGMNGYQTFKQVPDFRLEMAKNISDINLKIQSLEYRVSTLERSLMYPTKPAEK